MAEGSIARKRKTRCKIVVDGTDVTDKMDPHLISVTVIDKKIELDTCSIELDDRDGSLAVPPNKAHMEVLLGWDPEGPQIPPVPPPPSGGQQQGGGGGGGGDELGWEGSLTVVFQGIVDSVESGFARRGGGRRLWIEGIGGDLYLNGKTPVLRTWGEGEKVDTDGTEISGGVSLKQVMDDAAKVTGSYKMQMPDKIANIKRDFWQQDESFHNFGMRLADEIGADFKTTDDIAVMTDATSNKSVSGQDLPKVKAEWGVNLISWRIKPYVGRPQYKDTRTIWYDPVNGEWSEVKRDIPQGSNPQLSASKAMTQLPSAAPNKQVGSQRTDNAAAEVQIGRGTGWVIINGEPKAMAKGTMEIVGAREGVDGEYQMIEVEHSYSRMGGYTTRCILAKPEPGDIIQGDPMGGQ